MRWRSGGRETLRVDAVLLLLTIEHMSIQRTEHVGVVVDDLAATIQFFIEFGLELQGQATVEGRWVDRVVGLEGVRAHIAMMQTPDGNGRLELTKFHSPSIQGDSQHVPVNTGGYSPRRIRRQRHLCPHCPTASPRRRTRRRRRTV